MILAIEVTTFQHLYNEQGVITPICAILRAVTRVTGSQKFFFFFFVVTGSQTNFYNNGCTLYCAS